MAKTKTTKLTNLFEGRRRKAYLVRYEHLKDRGEYGRFKLSLRLPLLNEPIIGMNGVISDAFALLAKDDSQMGRTMLEVKLDGMTLEFFSTGDLAQSKIPVFSSSGVSLCKLALAPNLEGEKREVNLELSAYVPASEQLRDWAYVMIHKEFHLEAVYSQTEMEFGESESTDEDDPDSPAEDDDSDIPFGEDAELDPDNETDGPIAPTKKSGPVDLAAYHARQREKYKPGVN
jgi:hypothetical protein